MPKKYRSDALAAIHETMESLREIGAIEKQTICGLVQLINCFNK